MPEGTTTSVEPSLPLPAIADRKGRVGVERSAVPPLIALITSLVAISSNQPRALLLFIGAGTVLLGLYIVVPPKDDERTHPAIMSAFLRRLPNVLAAVGCVLVVLGLGVAFPNQVALIPLFLFVSFAALAAFSGMMLAVWITATLYGAALISLVTFVVLAFMA